MNALEVGQPLTLQLHPAGLALSFVVGMAGSLAALHCAGLMFRRNGTLDWKMALAAAGSLGGVASWAMHFLGLLGWQPGVPVGYELLPTLLSLFAATGLSGLGLFLAGRGGRFGVAGWITGSLCAGIGACLMLWLAMEAMALRAELEWNLQAVGAAAAMAMVTASAALWLAFNLRRPAQRVAAAVALGAAFCATHQLGMAAATLVGTKAAPAGRLVIGSSHLDLVVCLAAVVVLLAIHSMLAARAAVASAREQLLRQLHA